MTRVSLESSFRMRDKWLMPNRVRIVTVTDADRVKLERRGKDRGAPAPGAGRGRVVMLGADGLTGPPIRARVGCTQPTGVKRRRPGGQAGPRAPEGPPRP